MVDVNLTELYGEYRDQLSGQESVKEIYDEAMYNVAIILTHKAQTENLLPSEDLGAFQGMPLATKDDTIKLLDDVEVASLSISEFTAINDYLNGVTQETNGHSPLVKINTERATDAIREQMTNVADYLFPEEKGNPLTRTEELARF